MKPETRGVHPRIRGVELGGLGDRNGLKRVDPFFAPWSCWAIWVDPGARVVAPTWTMRDVQYPISASG